MNNEWEQVTQEALGLLHKPVEDVISAVVECASGVPCSAENVSNTIKDYAGKIIENAVWCKTLKTSDECLPAIADAAYYYAINRDLLAKCEHKRIDEKMAVRSLIVMLDVATQCLGLPYDVRYPLVLAYGKYRLNEVLDLSARRKAVEQSFLEGLYKQIQEQGDEDE